MTLMQSSTAAQNPTASFLAPALPTPLTPFSPPFIPLAKKKQAYLPLGSALAHAVMTHSHSSTLSICNVAPLA